MPMIKKRKKMDKNKRRSLFGADKILKLDDPIKNKIKQPLVKKTKNDRIIDVKIEKQPTKDIQLKEESKHKRQSVNKITGNENIEKPMKEIQEVVGEKLSKLSKLPPKTEQRYVMYFFIFKNIH